MSVEAHIRDTLARKADTVTIDPGAWDEIDRRSRRRSRQGLALAAAALVAVITGGVAAVAATGDDVGDGSKIATDPAPVSEPVTATSSLRRDGMAGIVVGMTEAEAEAATGQLITPVPELTVGNCAAATIDGAPDGLMVILDGGVVRSVSIEADDPGSGVRVRNATENGLAVGMDESQVRARHPHTEKLGGDVGPLAVYIDRGPDDPHPLDIRIEVESGVVTGLAGGYAADVHAASGCAGTSLPSTTTTTTTSTTTP